MFPEVARQQLNAFNVMKRTIPGPSRFAVQGFVWFAIITVDSWVAANSLQVERNLHFNVFRWCFSFSFVYKYVFFFA